MPETEVRAPIAVPSVARATSRPAAAARSRQRWSPLLWTAFSAGGTVAALLYPVHILLACFAFPLGWLPQRGYDASLALARQPMVRAYLFVLVALPLFHWAHRFRYTLYDGLQLKHLAGLIAALCYGAAMAGTALVAYVIWSL